MRAVNVVLVTSNHPYEYKGGERMFVAPELQRLVRAGLQVRVAPMHAVGQRMDLPAGAELDLGLADALRRGRITDALLAWRWPGFMAEWARASAHGGLVGRARVWRWAASAQATWRWARSLPADRPMVAYTYWRGGATLALARLAAARPRVVAVTRVHGYELYEDRFRPPFQPWTSVYDKLERIVTVSQHGLEHLRAGGVPAERLWLSRLGTEDSGVAARASDDGVLRVLSCSFMLPVKRVPLIARAIVALARRRAALPVRWTHLGDGPDWAAVRRVLADAPANLEAILPGRVSLAAVQDHYAAEPVDVFVLLSRSEGLPVSVQEALAAGVPVVATDVGGVREAVTPSHGALLGPQPDADQVADTIAAIGLARDPAMRRAARAHWTRHFDAERNHGDFARRLSALALEL